jgi:5-methylcytosine-specific restriction endonuclease McrA
MVADGAVLKRPAGSGTATQFRYVVKWDPNNGDKTRSRNVFTCLHYCRSKKHIKKSFPTMSADDMKVALSDVLREAGAVWGENTHWPWCRGRQNIKSF